MGTWPQTYQLSCRVTYPMVVSEGAEVMRPESLFFSLPLFTLWKYSLKGLMIPRMKWVGSATTQGIGLSWIGAGDVFIRGLIK